MTTDKTHLLFDKHEAGDYESELYNPQVIADGVHGLDAIDNEQEAFYRKHGYVVVHETFGAYEVGAALQAIDNLIGGRNEQFGSIMFEAAAKKGLELSPDQRHDRVRKLFNFVKYDDRLNSLAHHPKLLKVVKQLLGNREPKLFQDMALLKSPKVGREKPWHQDHAYFNVDMKDRIIGVWIALDEATVENGCMQVLDSGHKSGPIHHWQRRDWQICDTDVLGKSSVACPLLPGGALFFDSLLPHGTPKNDSPKRRRALQFHYAPANAAPVTKDQRLAIFGTEGEDVTC